MDMAIEEFTNGIILLPADALVKRAVTSTSASLMAVLFTLSLNELVDHGKSFVIANKSTKTSKVFIIILQSRHASSLGSSRKKQTSERAGFQ